VLDLAAGKEEMLTLEMSMGSPDGPLYMILKRGALVWYTAMVYDHGIQEMSKQI
jgi:hypothetical protein